MVVKTINDVVTEFEKEYDIFLSKVKRKKIIYDGYTNNDKSIVVVTPESKIYPRGNGWVDFTKIQIDIFKQYSIAICVFRISDGITYYLNLNDLFPFLTDSNMMINTREGEHWKIDIWPNKLVVRNGGQNLSVVANAISDISDLVKTS